VTLELQRLTKLTRLHESFCVFRGNQKLEGLLTEIPKMIKSKIWGRKNDEEGVKPTPFNLRSRK
jgi:hypothetical protein